jgi:hypothetical protein
MEQLKLLPPFDEPLVPLEVPLAWPLPLEAASGSQEGHIVKEVCSGLVFVRGKSFEDD